MLDAAVRRRRHRCRGREHAHGRRRQARGAPCWAAVLQWSVEAMAAAQLASTRVIVVARADRVARARRRQPWLRDVTVVAGGEHRSDSVRAGVRRRTPRSCSSTTGRGRLRQPALADAVAAAAAEHGAAVPAVPVVDSLKRDAAARRSAIGRSRRPGSHPDAAGRAARPAARRVRAAAGGASFTDEAALLESRGVAIATVPGEATNIKVTYPSDLEIVARPSPRPGRGDDACGFGQDSHGFGPDDGLWLGGIAASRSAPRLYGHSDGDVVLHAAGDGASLGVRPRRPRPPLSAVRSGPRGIASAELLREAVAPCAEAGWVVDLAQVSIVGARPKPRWPAARRHARANVAELLAARSAIRSPSARRTGNLIGAEGAGRVISATALVAATSAMMRAYMALRSHATPSAARSRTFSRSSPATSACTAAGRRSMARPTSATSARSCSATCCVATSSGRATASPG